MQRIDFNSISRLINHPRKEFENEDKNDSDTASHLLFP